MLPIQSVRWCRSASVRVDELPCGAIAEGIDFEPDACEVITAQLQAPPYVTDRACPTFEQQLWT
jgi:hypothetical protein